RAGHRVEAGGKHDGIDRVELAAGDDAVAGDALDRRAIDIDRGNVRTIERLEIVRVDAEPLAAEDALRRERGGDGRIGYYVASLRGDDLPRRVIRLLVDQEIRERTEERQAAPPPAELVFAPPLRLRHF